MFFIIITSIFRIIFLFCCFFPGLFLFQFPLFLLVFLFNPCPLSYFVKFIFCFQNFFSLVNINSSTKSLLFIILIILSFSTLFLFSNIKNNITLFIKHNLGVSNLLFQQFLCYLSFGNNFPILLVSNVFRITTFIIIIFYLMINSLYTKHFIFITTFIIIFLHWNFLLNTWYG